MSFQSWTGYGTSGASSKTWAPSSTRAQTAVRNGGRTVRASGAQPRSPDTAMRRLDQSTGRVTAPRRSPGGTGQVWSSAAVGPDSTDRARAASRTVRVSGPSTDSVGQPRNPGILGTSPNVGLCPTSPQNAAGILIDPPPSVPRASGVAP